MNIDSDIITITESIAPRVPSAVEKIRQFLLDVPTLFPDPDIPFQRTKFEFCLVSSEYSFLSELCKNHICILEEVSSNVLWHWRTHLENFIPEIIKRAEFILAAKLMLKHSKDLLNLELAKDLDLIPADKTAEDDDGPENNPLYLYFDELLD